MCRIPVDIDGIEAIAPLVLARAHTRHRLGTAAADDRARAFRWLQDHVEEFLDLGFLADRERPGR